jgi:Rap1a immunity proteins
MNKAWMLALILCVAAVPRGEAQQQNQTVGESGNAFLSLCGDMPDSAPKAPALPPEFHWGICLGYVRGVDDGVQTAYDILNETQPYCLPSEVTNGQMIRVLIKFIKDHPEKAHSKTRVLEIESFMDAFPCKQPSKKR